MYEKMLEIHNKIKENPFRLDFETNIRYYKGYFDLLFELEDMFYQIHTEAKKNYTTPQLADIPVVFFHDFRSAIISSKISARNLDADDYERFSKMGINKSKQSDRERLIERSRMIELNLSAIHSFIETGEFSLFYVFGNKGEGFIKFEWDYELQKWIVR